MIALTAETVDLIMPMHLRLDSAGVIRGAGPTLRKLRPGGEFAGQPLGAVFELRTTRLATATRAGVPLAQKLHLTFREGPSTTLKGIAVPVGEDDGVLLNLSFGISLIDAVRDYRLTASDFAATELAVEMLYMVEAKSAVLDETKQLNARLRGAKSAAEEQAYSDVLTGLKNRRAMDHVLTRLIGNRVPFALLHIDLDFFKTVNDTLGHAAGDHVLETVARILGDETREEDLVARVGGDEFVLLVPRVVDSVALRVLAERIIARLEAPIAFEGAPCRISASVGITTTSLYPEPSARQMLLDADHALYASKHAGRACVRFHAIGTPDGPLARDRPACVGRAGVVAAGQSQPAARG